MKDKTTELTILGALVLTLAAILLYDYLPKKRWVLYPNDDIQIEAYSDDEKGGPSHSEWINGDQSQWLCRVEEQGQFEYCGLNFLVAEDPTSAVDISGFDQVYLELEPIGKAHDVRFFMRNYNEHYSTPGDYNSAKFINSNIRPADMGEEVQIGLNEFTVADWWLAERDLPRDLARPEFKNIIALGFDYRGPREPGSYNVRIKKLELVGDWVAARHWYLGILIVWLGSVVIIYQDRKRLSTLTSYNADLQQTSKKYQELSALDPLTGLFNRYGFKQAAEKILPSERDEKISLVLVDIDYFKRINDRRGHNVGDQVINQFAEVITQSTREQDIVCRWGGEEFLLLCPNTSAPQAYALAEKIRTKIFDTQFDEKSALLLTASFGVCELEPGEDLVNAVARADKALYTAKDWGRNCTVVAEATPESSR